MVLPYHGLSAGVVWGVIWCNVQFFTIQDSEPIGEVSIAKAGMECFAMEGIDGNHPPSPYEHCFMIRAQEDVNARKVRKPTFNFCAESREELLAWLSAFKKGMEELHFLETVKETNKRQSLLSNFSPRGSYSAWVNSNYRWENLLDLFDKLILKREIIFAVI